MLAAEILHEDIIQYTVEQHACLFDSNRGAAVVNDENGFDIMCMWMSVEE